MPVSTIDFLLLMIMNSCGIAYKKTILLHIVDNPKGNQLPVETSSTTEKIN